MTHWQCQSEKVWKRVKVKKYENVKKAFYSSILAFKSSSVKVWNCDIHQRHHTYQSCFWARIVQHLAGDKCYQVKVNQNCAETFVISSPVQTAITGQNPFFLISTLMMTRATSARFLEHISWKTLWKIKNFHESYETQKSDWCFFQLIFTISSTMLPFVVERDFEHSADMLR